MAYNKVTFEEEVIIDLMQDTVTAGTLLEGVSAHDRYGLTIEGIFIPNRLEALTAVATNIAHFTDETIVNRPFELTLKYEVTGNARADVYQVLQGQRYLARFNNPYGNKCIAILSSESIVGKEDDINNCVKLAPNSTTTDIIFTPSANGYLIMLKDNTGSDTFTSQAFLFTLGDFSS